MDGATLYACGQYDDGTGGSPVTVWAEGGAGARRVLPAGTNTLMSLKPLPDGALFAAAADPWLGVVAADGAARWEVAPAQIEPRGQRRNLAVSEDGMLVEFGLDYGGEDRRRFDIAALKLLQRWEDGRVRPAGARQPRHRRLGGSPHADPRRRAAAARALRVVAQPCNSSAGRELRAGRRLVPPRLRRCRHRALAP